MIKNPEDLYPVTIVKARYGGCYEGGVWLAFLMHVEDIPGDASGDDTACSAFFAETTLTIGRGSTPMEALYDLGRRLG